MFSSRVILLIILNSILFVLFQNCSPGFQMESLETSSFERTQKYLKDQGFHVYGDQVFVNDPSDFSQFQNKAVGFNEFTSSKWPDGVIYFDFQTFNVPSNIQEILKESCREWTNNSALSCAVADANQIQTKKSVLVVSTHFYGCWSSVGYFDPQRSDFKSRGVAQRTYPNQLNLNLNDPGCLRKGAVLHEMGHAIGFVHEHQRADRDNYIRFLNSNLILENWQGDLLYKFSQQSLNSFYRPYDINSIMHYGNEIGLGFKPDGSQLYAVVGNESRIIPHHPAQLSESDKTAVQELYGSARSIASLTIRRSSNQSLIANGDIIPTGEKVLLTIQGLGSSAMGCLETQNDNGLCNLNSNFKSLGSDPNWTFNGDKWHGEYFLQNEWAGVRVKLFYFDPSSNQRTEVKNFSIQGFERPQGQKPLGPINGYIDSFAGGVLKGWVCAQGYEESVGYHVYFDNNNQGDLVFLTAGSANLFGEQGVASACGTQNSNHRFSQQLSIDQRKLVAGKKIFIFGIHPRSDLGFKNELVNRSGQFIGETVTDVVAGRSLGSNVDSSLIAEAKARKAAEAKAVATAKAQALAEERKKQEAERKAANETRIKAQNEERTRQAAIAKAQADERAKKAAEVKAAALAKAQALAEERKKKAAERKAANEARIKAQNEERIRQAAIAKAQADERAKKAAEVKAAALAKAQALAEERKKKAAEQKAAVDAKKAAVKAKQDSN